MSGMRKSLSNDQAALSIVAGATIRSISKGLDHDSVVRIMPNTPAQIGAGVSVWTATDKTPPSVWKRPGRCCRPSAKRCTSPARNTWIWRRASAAAARLRVPVHRGAYRRRRAHWTVPDIAATLATQTVLGSAQLLQQTGRHPAELRNMVTSPGGTTAEGLMSLENNRFRAAVMEAVEAAYEKAVQLGEED